MRSDRSSASLCLAVRLADAGDEKLCPVCRVDFSVRMLLTGFEEDVAGVDGSPMSDPTAVASDFPK